ncbi:DUF1176 domain-containing protein [Sphingorhabdus sp. YGSMI21]|uniref:DUF1176 domain-containing protein n=1 Tax=Sphingorhabdus sp. YGSMI21 TaxID=2077182 RepID=UPI000C1E7C14|nr:DUF1176 domain-containing protein [Sphingorhabdus sp. YGSMI21]ATW02593.1 hypothetical protein CHN51_02935 [Sphingorhabdus sp. YGSMI21]
MSPISFIVGIFATLAAAAAQPPVHPPVQPGEIRTFRDWSVGCDNNGNCQAVSLVPDEGGAGFDDWDGPISIVRTAGSDDIFKIRVLFQPGDMDRYRMIIDGKLVDTGAIVQGDYPIEIVGTDAEKVAKAIINGKDLVIEGPGGENITQISLAGSSAALRYIDEKQQRAGTGTALVAKGTRAFRPANIEVPTILVDRWKASTLAPETGDIVALVEKSRCKDERYGLVEDQIFPLGKRGNRFRALVLISCGSGAYNFSSAPYIGEYVENPHATSGWTFTPARFDRQPSWGGEGTDPLLVNAGWDELDQKLSSYGKGRGLGDCGSAENYIWDGDMFRMIDASAMPECRGAYAWITIWRANYRILEETAAPAE